MELRAWGQKIQRLQNIGSEQEACRGGKNKKKKKEKNTYSPLFKKGQKELSYELVVRIECAVIQKIKELVERNHTLKQVALLLANCGHIILYIISYSYLILSTHGKAILTVYGNTYKESDINYITVKLTVMQSTHSDSLFHLIQTHTIRWGFFLFFSFSFYFLFYFILFLLFPPNLVR